MADFYSELADVTTEIMVEFKQGVVTLRRVTPAAPGASPWVPGAPTTADVALNAAVKRVDTKYVDGTLILATDDQIVMSVPPGAAPKNDDLFLIDGRLVVTVDVRPLPAAGTPVAFIAFVRN